MEKLYKVRKTKFGVDCGSGHELLITKFRLEESRENQTPYDYTVQVTNRFKGVDLI